jgi:ABC-type transport system involved in multi-copper enzyme maturation permease subunit
MILNAFRSEWIKLRRPTLLWGVFGGLAVAASAFVILLFSQAAPVGPGSADLPSLAVLAQPNGLIHGVSRVVVLLGIVAFGVAAFQIASEYSLGTLRQLLVRQPRRAVLLVGKYLGVLSFIVAAVIFASLVAGGVAVIMAHLRHVPVGAWFSATGVKDLTAALGELLLAVVGFATLGLAVGLFLRSAVFAVIVGLAYLIAVESIIGRVLPAVNKWLPGQLLLGVGQGGNATTTFPRAVMLSAIYLVVVGLVTTYAFRRRDVTA